MMNQIISETESKMEESAIRQQVSNDAIQNELNEMTIQRIPLSEIYSAPSQWNEWSKLDDEKMVDLSESILNLGQQFPCILWKIDKSAVESLYSSKEDEYGFKGSSYMILSGHNRAYARKLISETENYSEDIEYQTVPAFVYTDSYSLDFIKKAQAIIDDTNYISRDKTPREMMRAILKKYDEVDRYSKNGTIADEIAKSLNITTRTVHRYTKLNKQLDKDILNILYNGKLSLRDALELCDYRPEVQEMLIKDHKNILTSSKLLKKFLTSTTPDMKLDEVVPYVITSDNEESFKKITVTIRKDLEDEFLCMVKEWKDKYEN